MKNKMLLKLKEYYNLKDGKYVESSTFYINTDNITCINEGSIPGSWIIQVNNTSRSWVIDELGMIDIKNALGVFHANNKTS